MTNDLLKQASELYKEDKIKEAVKLAEEKYPEGVYFDLPFSDYCDLPYFSRSTSKDVIFDLEEARYRRKNPIDETPAMALGTAIHSMILEPQDYKRVYVRAPSSEDYPGKSILKTVDDFKEILKGVGEKVSGKKEDIIERARAFIDSKKFVIWDETISNFHAEVEKHGKKILSNSDFETLNGIRQSYAMKNEAPRIIQNGYPEVTIIWKDEETNTMCKCRLDYVRPEAIGDVKSFSVKDKSKPLFEYLGKETTRNYYNYQYVIYAEALETIINKINAGTAKTYGEVDDAWMKDFLDTPLKQFFLVYVRTAPPYQIKAYELEKDEQQGGTSNAYYSVAKENWRFAITKYARAVETEIWKEREVMVLEDQHVPGVIYQTPIY